MSDEIRKTFDALYSRQLRRELTHVSRGRRAEKLCRNEKTFGTRQPASAQIPDEEVRRRKDGVGVKALQLRMGLPDSRVHLRYIGLERA
jgi:hypothetical protein